MWPFVEVIPCLRTGNRKSSATNSRQSADRHYQEIGADRTRSDRRLAVMSTKTVTDKRCAGVRSVRRDDDAIAFQFSLSLSPLFRRHAIAVTKLIDIINLTSLRQSFLAFIAVQIHATTTAAYRITNQHTQSIHSTDLCIVSRLIARLSLSEL